MGDSWNWVAVTKRVSSWNILFMPSQLHIIFIILHIYINCAIALTDFHLLNLMELEDLINHLRVFYKTSTCLSTCLCAPRHPRAMTHTTTWQTHGARQAIPCCNRTRNVRTDQALCGALGFALAYLAVHHWQGPTLLGDFFVTGRWGSRHPRDHGDREGAGTAPGSPQRVAVATEVPCRVSWSPSRHAASSLSCWDRSPHVATPW